jgi:epoxyqueuosine reductase
VVHKQDVKDRALSLNFADVGFTTAEPFESQREILVERKEAYAWAKDKGVDLEAGIDPRNVMPDAQSIIVLVENYFSGAYPTTLAGRFGRPYLDDDRQTKRGLYKRIKAFREYLRENGIDSKVPFNIPHRLAAARAGVGTFGKNTFLYATKSTVAGKSSWINPIPVVVNYAFEPDAPTINVACPSWCKNACVASCPTGALSGSQKMDPRKCISYMTYYGEEITPLELREPMGTWVYGCDRCQETCPRNNAWLRKELPPNPHVTSVAKDFDLVSLLHMDVKYFSDFIRPNMFYMSAKDLWKWKMNVVRVMGNSLDHAYVPELVRAFKENSDARVLGMIAWALGRLGGDEAQRALETLLEGQDGLVREEILRALEW